MRLLRLLASRNSARHHFEPAHTGETRKITISQSSAARFNASCQRSPALRPPSASRSRKMSSQPCARIQSRTAMASAMSALEWLRKIRDMALHIPRGTNPLRRGRKTNAYAYICWRLIES